MKKEKKNTGHYYRSYLKRQPFTTNFELNQCIPSKVIEGKQYLYLVFYPNKNCQKRNITWPNFVAVYQYWTWPVFNNDISFCKLSIKSMHPCKSYWAETNIKTPTKSKLKKGHNCQNFANDCLYWTWPVLYNNVPFCKLSIKSMHPCISYWAETNINTPT